MPVTGSCTLCHRKAEQCQALLKTYLRIEADLADVARDDGAFGLGYRDPKRVVDHCFLHWVHLPGDKNCGE